MLLAQRSRRRPNGMRMRSKWNSISPSNEPTPNIWLVLDLCSNKNGSLEGQLIAVADRLRMAPVRATFVFDTDVPTWLDAALAERGVETRVLPFRRPLRAAAQLTGWFMADAPDLVHFHF